MVFLYCSSVMSNPPCFQYDTNVSKNLKSYAMPTVKYQSPPKEVNHMLPWENEPVAHDNNRI